MKNDREKKLIQALFCMYYLFLDAPDDSVLEDSAYIAYRAIFDELRLRIGYQKTMTYSIHMEYLASCKKWEHNQNISVLNFNIGMKAKYGA